MGKLSVVISAYNDEKKIRDCLESVRQLAPEIIFIDNSSTDKTPQIAREYTSKIYTRPNNPMLNVNKNYGFTKATGDWILNLDSDERVTPELKREIKKIIGNWKLEIGNSRVSGYWIPRKNIIFGKWIRHTGWYPDYQLRLFKKGKGSFPEVHVHEMVEVRGETASLQGHIEHLNYESILQFLVKLTNIYVPNEAKVLIDNGYKFSWQDALGMPAKEFINRFFAQKGYKDGLHGLVLSLLMAFYHLIVFTKIWEEKGFKVYKKENFLQAVAKEFQKVGKDLRYWILTEQIGEAKNFAQKLKGKLLRKLTW